MEHAFVCPSRTKALDVAQVACVQKEDMMRVRRGNKATREAMLVSHAQTLASIFTELAKRSALNMGRYVEASERFVLLRLRLSLRAGPPLRF